MTRLRPSLLKQLPYTAPTRQDTAIASKGGEACILFADSSSKDLAVPEAIDGAPVTAIAAGAFSDLVDLERVSLPDSLTSIGAEAFARCTNLRAAKLGCALESIGEGTFRGCRRLERLDLPKSLTSIGNSAFSNTSLSRLAIPSSCVNIGDDGKPAAWPYVVWEDLCCYYCSSFTY